MTPLLILVLLTGAGSGGQARGGDKQPEGLHHPTEGHLPGLPPTPGTERQNIP